MKRIYLITIAAIVLSSCSEDFIDLNPPSNLNSVGFYKTPTDINQGVLSAYGNLRSVYNKVFIDMSEIRSDNTTYTWWFSNAGTERGIDDFSAPLLPDNGISTETWDGAYATIMRCNVVIDRIGGVAFTDQGLKGQYEGEVKFLRALMYFWLNRLYGGTDLNGNLSGVIKVDKEISPEEAYSMGRASLQEMYELIVTDLKFAEENLPEQYSAADKGRVTRAGAKGLLGKVYMTMAGYPLNKGIEYYNLAVDKFEEVINNPLYALVPSYKDLFDVNIGKNSSESLFEIQYKKGSPNNATGSPWNNSFAPRSATNGEVAAFGETRGENIPTEDMENAYEYGDPRKWVSMREGYISARTGEFVPGNYVSKYYDVSTGSRQDNGNNWIELRLADIYLLYAEALVRTNGDKNVAVEYVNKIRERARNTPGNPDITSPADLLEDYQLSDFSTDQELLLAIEDERRIELAFENHRWFDLVRTERAEEVMVAEQIADGYGPFTWSDHMMAYPIPAAVMQSNPGNVIQNQGYVQM